MSKKLKTKVPQPKRTNFWDMCQNIMIYGMRSGQSFVAIIGLLLIIAFVKMDGDQIYDLLVGTGELFSKLYVLGWVLFGVLLLYTQKTLKKLRIRQNTEMARIADEKSDLQIQMSEKAFKSSRS